MTKVKLFYFLLPVLTAVLALCLEVLTLDNGPLLGDVAQQNPTILYMVQIVCALSTMLGAFMALKFKHFHPLLRLFMVITPAELVILEYFMFYDTNLLSCLCLLGVAYLMLWNVTEE